MSLFEGLERRISTEVDRVFGDPILIIPKARAEYTSSTDPARPERTVIGVWDNNPMLAQPLDKGQYDSHQPDFTAEKVHVSFDTERLGPPSLWPQQGDILQATTIAGAPRAKVADHRHDGVGRVVFICAPIK